MASQRTGGLARTFWASRWGIVGQGMTLIVVALPIVLGLQEALVYVVAVSAMVTVPLPLLTQAIGHRLPAVIDPRRATNQFVAAVSVVGLSVLGVLSLATILLVSGAFQGGEFWLGIAMLLAGQGAYTCMTALAVRRGDHDGLMIGRSVYAATSLLLTVAASLSLKSGISLIAATSIGFLVAAIYLVGRSSRRRGLVPCFSALRHTLRLRSASEEFRAGLVLSFSLFLGNLASQAGALSVGLLGPYQAAWAVVVRISSGFQTLGVFIIGPSVDIEIAAAVREKDQGRLHREHKRGLFLALIVAAGSSTLCFLTLSWLEPHTLLPLSERLPLWFAVLSFGGLAVGLSVIERILGIVPGAWLRLVWDSTHAVISVLLLLLVSGESLLWGLGVISMSRVATYIWFSRIAIRRAIRQQLWAV